MSGVPLSECPPGLFMFDGTLCFRSEYTTTLENPRRYQPDAYVVESGEYFWGGAKSTEERSALIVSPIQTVHTPAEITAREAASAEAMLRECVEAAARAIYAQWHTQAGWVPWVEGGNSDRQCDARRLAWRAMPPLGSDALARMRKAASAEAKAVLRRVRDHLERAPLSRQSPLMDDIRHALVPEDGNASAQLAAQEARDA